MWSEGIVGFVASNGYVKVQKYILWFRTIFAIPKLHHTVDIQSLQRDISMQNGFQRNRLQSLYSPRMRLLTCYLYLQEQGLMDRGTEQLPWI